VLDETLAVGLRLLTRHGRKSDAEALRARVADLDIAWQLERFAEEYATVRQTRASSVERTSQLTSMLHRPRRVVRAREWTRDDATAAWRSGDEGKRIFALLLLQEKPELASAALLADGIRGSRSAFEQYHALRAACRSDLPPHEAAIVRAAIEAELRGEQRPDGFVPELAFLTRIA